MIFVQCMLVADMRALHMAFAHWEDVSAIGHGMVKTVTHS